jgi:uncharacterized protein (DUF2461 family)
MCILIAGKCGKATSCQFSRVSEWQSQSDSFEDRLQAPFLDVVDELSAELHNC